MKEKISVCIIMKNEEKHIGKCLDSLIKMGFGPNGENGEILVVDTGSEDTSCEIVKNMGCRLEHFTWVNDFAKAKNYGLSKAAYRYVMVVDADEYLTELDEANLDEFFLNKGMAIGQVSRNNFIMADGMGGTQRDWTERIFDKNLYAFEGRIHEQVAAIGTVKTEYVKLRVTFDHDGYLMDEETAKRKSERNRSLLLEEYRAGKNDAYTCFQLAQSYMLERNTREALGWFEKGLAFDLDPKAEYVQMLVTGYAECLLDNDRAEQALELKGIYEEFSFCPDYCFVMGQIYMANNRYLEAYGEFIKCLSMDSTLEKSVGVTSFYSLHNIGVINEILGEKEGAKAFYEKAAAYGYERSIKRLKEL